MQDSDYIVDYVFIGLGAANSLIIKQMHAHDLLSTASLVIIDPDEKMLNDKTFCFWAQDKEITELGFASLINHSWGRLGINDDDPQSVWPYTYHHISSLTLYDEIRSILSSCNVEFIREQAESIEKNPNASILTVKTLNHIVNAKHVFDSRPPLWNSPQSNQTFLLQSFYGWRITTEEPQFDSNTFTMMDFSVDQSIATQFVYILPFSSTHALIELTRFGASPIDYEYAQEQLKEYCREKQFGSYVIETEEQGIIPMSSCTLQEESRSHGLFRTGSGAGKVKPSTGYAFKEMARDAIHIVKSLNNEKPPQRVIHRSGRFAFYDRLLLKILELHPHRGKEIFEDLFHHVRGTRVLQFLEEKTSFIEDIAIFMALPKALFMKYAIKDIFALLSRNLLGLIPLSTSLIFLLCEYLGLGLLNWIILAIGMIVIGIPHGAMDHVLNIPKRSISSLSLFILGYIAKGMIMFAIWIISPIVGLITFLLYSMWHFGQAEYEQENVHNKGLIFLRGFAVLSFILGTHIPETNVIINALSIPSIPDTAGLLTSSLLSESSILLLLMTEFLQPRKSTILSTASLLMGIFLPLLQAFGVYFVFHHSVLGWNHLKKGLNKTHLELLELSTPFSITAIGTLFLFFINTGYTLTGFAPLFFVLLSCLSFP
ncbi:MAG: beta-carotene 15,15'-dioxygenase, Brp/Blh family, partial [Ignavibacteria bacterium]